MHAPPPHTHTLMIISSLVYSSWLLCHVKVFVSCCKCTYMSVPHLSLTLSRSLSLSLSVFLLLFLPFFIYFLPSLLHFFFSSHIPCFQLYFSHPFFLSPSLSFTLSFSLSIFCSVLYCFQLPATFSLFICSSIYCFKFLFVFIKYNNRSFFAFQPLSFTNPSTPKYLSTYLCNFTSWFSRAFLCFVCIFPSRVLNKKWRRVVALLMPPRGFISLEFYVLKLFLTFMVPFTVSLKSILIRPPLSSFSLICVSS